MGKSVLFTNGNFYCGKSAFADSLFCCDGKIEKIGSAEEMQGIAKDAEEVMDLQGKFAFPDFCNFIREVEVDFSETGEEMLNLYDKKMGKKVLEGATDRYLETGGECTFAVYDTNIITATLPNRFPAVRQLIVDGELSYDEDSYADEQWMWLMMKQYY